MLIKNESFVVLAFISSSFVSADETFNSDWCNMEPNEAEVLILNLTTNRYCLPESLQKMSKLKVLIVKNSDLRPCELNNFELLGSLSNLKRLRMEKVSVPSLAPMKNLQKLSLYMCDTNRAFENSSIPIKEALPSLVDLNIDYCKDFVELPAGICEVATLKKLSITNCHKFSGLPQDIGKLENLELLRLCCCSDLVELPESITRLHNLRLLDISYCISLCKLPEEIDRLENLRKLYMTSCSRCELPDSTMNLEHLERVVCDQETATSWEAFESFLPNLKIEVPEIDINLNWLYGNRC